MLKQLLIKNIILIESAAISFEKGLNVLSGETGSGKSAIMNALSLALGAKSDAKIVRHGSEKGIVEASFDIDNELYIQHILAEAGIDHEKGEELIIRREINTTGKSRCFINNQATQSKLLLEIAPFLARIVGQHANQWLLSIEKHREIIDIFGELEKETREFALNFNDETKVLKQLNELIECESKRVRAIDVCRQELEELETANLKQNEDEELFSEYSLLANAEARSLKADEITETLSGQKTSLIAILNRQSANLESLCRIDQTLNDSSTSFKNAIIEIQEVFYTLNAYRSHIEHNPERSMQLNDRLTLITKLKKKYGNSLLEIETYKEESIKKLKELESQDELVETLKDQHLKLRQENDQLAEQLSLKRKSKAKKFEKEIMLQLHVLNMPNVVFEVEFSKQKRNSKGDDQIEFYLIPNVGEHKIPIKSSASGGELSRILLAIQTLLAKKERIPTLIFDEIDANIGGETAFIIGSKLKEIGSSTQVLCITHFAQVAKQADHHLQIFKNEINGRTFSHVVSLTEDERQDEISRMLGTVTAPK